LVPPEQALSGSTLTETSIRRKRALAASWTAWPWRWLQVTVTNVFGKKSGTAARSQNRIPFLVGVRDLDEEERRALELSKVLVVPAAALKRRGGRGSLVTALEQLRSQTDEIYLHLDIDVLDPEEAPGVEFRSRGGLFLNEMEPALETIGKYFRIRAANLAAYNPDLDENDTTLRSGFRLLAAVVDAVSARRDV